MYQDVKADKAQMEKMLDHSGGQRKVPVIVEENGKVTVGYGGT